MRLPRWSQRARPATLSGRATISYPELQPARAGQVPAPRACSRLKLISVPQHLIPDGYTMFWPTSRLRFGPRGGAFGTRSTLASLSSTGPSVTSSLNVKRPASGGVGYWPGLPMTSEPSSRT